MIAEEEHVERRPSKWLWAGIAAAAVGGSFLFNRVSARRAETQHPPAGSFVNVDGIQVHYVEGGDGPAVVLLHGNGVTLRDYEVSGVLALAAQRHRVIAFDRPGFGYTDRPRTTVWTPYAQAQLISRALKQLGVEQAVIVGHSWGTMVALAMALEQQEQVAGLVLLSGYYYETARPDVVPMSAPAFPIVGNVLANTVSPIFGRLMTPAGLKASFHPAPISSKFSDFPLALTLRPSQIRATAADTAMMVPAAALLSPRYGEIDTPTIVMAGDGDLIARVGRHAKRVVSDIDEAELRIIEEQGHLFHYAVPEQVAAAIDDVWTRVRQA